MARSRRVKENIRSQNKKKGQIKDQATKLNLTASQIVAKLDFPIEKYCAHHITKRCL